MQFVLQLWRCGRRYLRAWPLAAPVAQTFVDSQLIRIWRATLWLAPGTALLSLWWLNLASPLGLATGVPWLLPVMLATLPLQLLLVFGWRAAQPLPRAEARWLSQLRDQLTQSGVELEPLQTPPSYHDLAVVLAAFHQQWPDERQK